MSTPWRLASSALLLVALVGPAQAREPVLIGEMHKRLPGPRVAAPTTAPDIVLLFPGFNESCSYFDDFTQELIDGGRDPRSIICVPWPQGVSLSALETWAQHFLPTYLAAFPEDARITVVGHSAGSVGGPIAAVAAGLADRIDQIVCVNGAVLGWDAPAWVLALFPGGFQGWGGSILSDELLDFFNRYDEELAQLHLHVYFSSSDDWISEDDSRDMISMADDFYGGVSSTGVFGGGHHVLQDPDLLVGVADVVERRGQEEPEEPGMPVMGF